MFDELGLTGGLERAAKTARRQWRAWRRLRPGRNPAARQIRTIIADSLDLPADKVSVTRMYRCNANTNRVATKDNCPTNSVVTSYVKIEIRDTYEPVWTQFGVGRPVNFQVNRMVVLLS